MTLLMRDQENLERGLEQGLEQGLKQGLKQGKEIGRIYGTISAYKELNLTEDTILSKLMEKFQLTEDEAKEYLRDAE